MPTSAPRSRWWGSGGCGGRARCPTRGWNSSTSWASVGRARGAVGGAPRRARAPRRGRADAVAGRDVEASALAAWAAAARGAPRRRLGAGGWRRWLARWDPIQQAFDGGWARSPPRSPRARRSARRSPAGRDASARQRRRGGYRRARRTRRAERLELEAAARGGGGGGGRHGCAACASARRALLVGGAAARRRGGGAGGARRVRQLGYGWSPSRTRRRTSCARASRCTPRRRGGRAMRRVDSADGARLGAPARCSAAARRALPRLGARSGARARRQAEDLPRAGVRRRPLLADGPTAAGAIAAAAAADAAPSAAAPAERRATTCGASRRRPARTCRGVFAALLSVVVDSAAAPARPAGSSCCWRTNEVASDYDGLPSWNLQHVPRRPSAPRPHARRGELKASCEMCKSKRSKSYLLETGVLPPCASSRR